MTDVFDAFGGDTKGMNFNTLLFLLAQVFPLLLSLPTPHSMLTKKLNDTMGEIANALLTKSREEKEAGTLGESEEKSILGLLSMFARPPMSGGLTQVHLVRAENQDGQLYLTREEVIGQVRLKCLYCLIT